MSAGGIAAAIVAGVFLLMLGTIRIQHANNAAIAKDRDQAKANELVCKTVNETLTKSIGKLRSDFATAKRTWEQDEKKRQDDAHKALEAQRQAEGQQRAEIAKTLADAETGPDDDATACPATAKVLEDLAQHRKAKAP